MKKSQLFKAGAASFALSVALVSAPAFAQDAEQTDDAAAQDPIVVTGSRIPQPNITAASPVTVVNSQEVKLSGVTRTEDLINQLPQAFADQGGNVSNGASGTANINLRGLGAERTMVLINGRRLVPGDPNSSAADINFIPASMIKRVDVLTGGASSVYGADAVGGVVNFIMDTKFEGVRFDVNYGLYQHDNDGNPRGIRDALAARGFAAPSGNSVNGGSLDATLSIGAGFDDDRGHVMGYVGYRKINKVTQDSRIYSACASQAIPTENRIICGGSATSPNGSFILYDDGTSTFFQVGSGRNFIPGLSRYNFAPTNYYQRPDDRYTAGFFADYEVSDAFKPYLEGMFMDDRSVAQIAPSGNFGNTFSINCDNPLLSAQQLAIVCDTENLLTLTPNADGVLSPPPVNGPASTVATSGLAPFNFIDPVTGLTYQRGFLQILRRNVEGGPRQDDLQHTAYRIVTGARGDIAKGLSYDAYYQYGRTNFAETYYNDFSVTRLGRALDVVAGPGGTPVCRSALNGTDTNCVPWDIFAPGQVSSASIAYLQTPGFQRGVVSEQVASGSITALLGEYGVKSPWADDGFALNLGAEYRKESLELKTDAAFSTGDLAGQGAPTLPIKGSFNVKEFFGELRAPLISESFIHELTFTGGYRYSDYSVLDRSFSTNTYKAQLEFAPIRDIRFRASYNRAVRAPNIQEYFAANRVALNGNGDPCAGATPDATLAECQNDPFFRANPGMYGRVAGNPAGQYNGFIGGNANLTPEKADTLTLGAVIQPRIIPGLALTVDWFDIKLKNRIATIGQDTTLETCYSTGDPYFCGLIHRDATGSLWRSNAGFVVDTNQNIGALKTRGVDVGLSYNRSVGALGKLGLAMNGTWLDKLTTDNGVSDPYDCSGFYGLICGTPNPTWRHRARVSLTTESGIGASVQWRYISSVKIDRSSSQASLTNAYSPFNYKLPTMNYFDLAVTAEIGDHYNFRLGINNLLDKRPPIVGANGTSGVINACSAVFCNGNTYPGVYDALGRYIFTGITLDF